MLNNATRWNRSKKFSFEIDLQDNPVTSVRVTGDFVLTGHFSGILCLWTQDRGFLIDFCDFAHNDVITDMVVGDVFNKGPYILGREDQKDIRYLSKHHFVISASIDGHVHVRGLGLSNIDSSGSLEGVSETMNLDQHSVPGVYLSLIGNSLATFSRDNTVTLWEISVPDHFRYNIPNFNMFFMFVNLAS
jgi:WD40 repeat protein